MKKWAVIDQKKNDEFIEIFDDKQQAIEQAIYDWEKMTKHDKNRSKIIVALVELEENNSYSDIYDIVWSSKSLLNLINFD